MLPYFAKSCASVSVYDASIDKQPKHNGTYADHCADGLAASCMTACADATASVVLALRC